MIIKTLIKSLDNFNAPLGLENFEVRGISCNSKTVKEGFVFVAIQGNREDGNKYIDEAIERGARAVIVQSSSKCLPCRPTGNRNVSFISVEDTRKALAKLAAEFYDKPSSKIKVVGITGTNGKTTITYLIEALLKKSHLSPAVIGTINYRFEDKIIASKNTTPGPVELQSMLDAMLKAGSNYAIMEVSSHALDQDRTEGIDFHSAIFTNLTQDHLDYHKNLKNYFESKAKLFKNISRRSFAVINDDDKYGRKIKELTKAQIITYGIENSADITARDIKFDGCATQFRLKSPKEETKFKTGLIGKHNVYNILATIAWAQKEGIDSSIIKSAIEEFSYVPGRLEKIDCNADFSVFVDYAHTEDALRNIIGTLRQISNRKIIVVFGCGGERDKTKRPKMGRVVSELADLAIITDDNPRFEDPEAIIKEIKKGIRKKNFCVIPERFEAIKKSLFLAKAGDIILVAGKGHENYQILKDKTIFFDDREAVRECLKSMKY
jgi:UDP-N-acetylmuramyl-tripeptide synthetase